MRRGRRIMQQIIRELEDCEKKLNQQYDKQNLSKQEAAQLSVAVKKVVTAIDYLDSYSKKLIK